jgi:hypothetical protein
MKRIGWGLALVIGCNDKTQATATSGPSVEEAAKRSEEAAKKKAAEDKANAEKAAKEAACHEWTALCPLGPNGSVERFNSRERCQSATEELRTTMGINCNPCRASCVD